QSFLLGTEPTDNTSRLEWIWRNSNWPTILRSLGVTGCHYCGARYATTVVLPDIHAIEYRYHCHTCGFSWRWSDTSLYGSGRIDNHDAYLAADVREADRIQIEARALLRLPINDARLGLDELGSHLRRRFTDVHSVPWRTFEMLVADIYRHLGYDVHLTQQTRD